MRSHLKMMPLACARMPDEILNEEEHDALWLRRLFLTAKEKKASDMHLKPVLDPVTWDLHFEAKIRIHGEKRFYGKLTDKSVIHAVILRLKTLAHFDLSTDEHCQDQAFSLKLTRCRYRANLMPTELGEAFVLRIIPSDEIPCLADLGLSQNLQRDFREALTKRRGLILFTGETGSGKSTTVQAGLMEVDREGKEVLAIEQPPERLLQGVKHVPITRQVSWSDALRAAMRADPEIIYVGEIRDQESARLALAAANTGHLVISTLHAACVAGIFDRLGDWGVDRRLVAENLIFATNQVLVKKLCSNCKRCLGAGYEKGPGCSACDRGIMGRMPLVEYSFLPSHSKIINFNKEEFERTELKASFAGEALRLAQLGLISHEEASLWAPMHQAK